MALPFQSCPGHVPAPCASGHPGLVGDDDDVVADAVQLECGDAAGVAPAEVQTVPHVHGAQSVDDVTAVASSTHTETQEGREMLNDLVRDMIAVNPPPAHKGKQLKIRYMTQADIRPPKFIVFVNEPELMHFSYLRYIENKLRESFGFEGTPPRLIVRGREEEEI